MHQQKTIPSWIVAAMVSVLGFAGIGTGSLAEGSNVASIKRAGPEWVADWTLISARSADVSNRSLASEMARDVEEIRERQSVAVLWFECLSCVISGALLRRTGCQTVCVSDCTAARCSTQRRCLFLMKWTELPGRLITVN